jgi:hypothetical protein
VPARDVIDVVVTREPEVSRAWRDADQGDRHRQYADEVQPWMCHAVDPANGLLWLRSPEYVPGANTDAAYLVATVPTESISGFGTRHAHFMRVRFRLPTVPSLPCEGCTLGNAHQWRYFSLSFQVANFPLVSLADSAFVRDAEGYATLIVGLGDSPPSHVKPENGYTYLDLSRRFNYKLLDSMVVRSILPSPGFSCNPLVIPFKTSEHHSSGGYLGEFVPVVDFLAGPDIPAIAEPYRQANSCGVAPPEPALTCSI